MGARRSSSWQQRGEGLQQSRRSCPLLLLLLLRLRLHLLSLPCKDWSEMVKISLVIYQSYIGCSSDKSDSVWTNWNDSCFGKQNKISVIACTASLIEVNRWSGWNSGQTILVQLIKQNDLQIILGNDNNCKNHKKRRDSLSKDGTTNTVH